MSPDHSHTSLRIAFIADWFHPSRGGIESQTLALARALQAAGHEVVVINSLPGDETVEGIRVIRLPAMLMPVARIAIQPDLASLIAAALSDWKPDIVHVHASVVAPTCLAGLYAARRLGLPVLLTFHSSLAGATGLLRQADRLFGWTDRVRMSAVSARIAGEVRSINPDRPVAILPNGFDLHFWNSPPWPQVPSADKPFRLAVAMRLERRKRPRALPAILERASQLSAATGMQIEMSVAGGGSLARPLARMASRSDPPARLLLTGWLDRDGLAALYRRSHAFLLPSVHEAFGIAALEARASGLPVIARRGTGLEDFIVPGEDGFLCGDDAGMAEAIHRLATDNDMWTRMAGPRPELSRYDWGAMVTRHLDLYRSVIESGGAKVGHGSGGIVRPRAE